MEPTPIEAEIWNITSQLWMNLFHKIKFRYRRTETNLVRAQVSNHLNVIPSFQNSKKHSKEPIDIRECLTYPTLCSVDDEVLSMLVNLRLFSLLSSLDVSKMLEWNWSDSAILLELRGHHNGAGCKFVINYPHFYFYDLSIIISELGSEMTTQKKV